MVRITCLPFLAAESTKYSVSLVHNLGLNDVAVEGFAAKTGNPRFAYDSYRRFIQMFGDVVLEIPKAKFDKVFDGSGITYPTTPNNLLQYICQKVGVTWNIYTITKRERIFMTIIF